MATTPSKYLLVEGKDDQHVLFNLLAKHDIPFDSKEKPRKDCPSAIRIDRIFKEEETDIDPADYFYSQLKLIPESGYLGIILDADFNLQGKWAALRSRLLKLGFPETDINKEPSPTGSIIRAEDKPAVGIWLMPDNAGKGELEHFLELLVPRKEENPLWLRVLNALESMPPEEDFPSYSKRFKEQDRRKAMIHTWLAWQEEPGKPLGQALTACYFDANAPHALVFIDWIRRLFALTPA
jgi:hypothetical protein